MTPVSANVTGLGKLVLIKICAERALPPSEYNRGMINWIEYAMAAVMLLGLSGGIWNRIRLNRSIGERFNQYVALILAVPATVILAIEKLIGPETSAAILGVTIGFAAAVAGRDIGAKKPTKRVTPQGREIDP